MNIYFRYIILFLSVTMLSCVLHAQGQQNGGSLKLSTVVIDAGHGGKDAGAVSKDRKVYEKHLTLAIAKLFGQKIKDAYPDVKVIYTRTTDKYLTLNERADIANRNKANLFVSIHINSVAQPSPNGFSVFILGKSNKKGTDMFSTNMDVCRRENSVILLEDDYSTKYQGFDPNDPESFIFFNLMQNAHFEQSLMFASKIDGKFAKGPFKGNRGIYQDAFYVLWKTTMPAVLVEAGFISNPEDLKVMNSEKGKEQIAQRLFDAFKEFKVEYDRSIDYSGQGSAKAEQTQLPAGNAQVSQPGIAEAGGTEYGVQVLLLSRRIHDGDKALKGYSAKVVQSGSMYRYIVGACSSEEQARASHRNIKKDFPDSFVVKVEDGKISRL
ncbi:MAG: N-acetylmuramoyl-L-alanine amidase [Bacteroidales bacterium]|nr:N-acetylmuramoyl-L-alanine amidase [Bacteroidales bacterium]